MPTGLECLYDSCGHADPHDPLVDIIAVHDLGYDPVETWTHLGSGVNWLRDLPTALQVARVFVFAYDASHTSFFGQDVADHLQRTAETFVQQISAFRSGNDERRRPIVFICHGLGGLVVKKALVYSRSRTAPKVEHLFGVFVSTFAILFFGTPHDRAQKSSWLADKHSAGDGAENVSFRAMSAEFAALVSSFRLFFFWEELETSFETRTGYVVGHASAVPQLDNTEKASIPANHRDMVKFEAIDCPQIRVVIEALKRYSQEAAPVIQRRWAAAALQLRSKRANEAYELSGILMDVHTQSEAQPQPTDPPQESGHFYPPVAAVDGFVGRSKMIKTISHGLFADTATQSSRKSFVVHGMGGSGKTQLCSKFAHEYRRRYHAVFTIRAASDETIEDSFKRIAVVGGLHPTESAGRHFLDQQRSAWLLIIDNADSPSLDLESLFPSSQCCHILITTRNPKFRAFGSAGSLELQGLNEDEALELLLTRAEISRPWNQKVRTEGNIIGKSLGHLALALIHAGNCICHQLCTLTNYLTLHSQTRRMVNRQDLRRRSSGPREISKHDDMICAVYSTFDISLQSLEQRQSTASRDAIEILRVSAFCHFENIPEVLFTRAVRNRTQNVSATAQKSLPSWQRYLGISAPVQRLPEFLLGELEALSESRITWALNELQSLSLVTRNAEHATFSLHPLVHQWAKDILTTQEKATWLTFSFNTLLESVMIDLGASGSKKEGNANDTASFHEAILPHLTICLEEHGNPISTKTADASWIKMAMWGLISPNLASQVRAELLNAGKCAVVFGERGHFEKAAKYLRGVTKGLLRLRGLYCRETIFVTSRLSNLYWGLGRLEESIHLHNRVVQAQAYLYGPDHEDTLITRSSLGHTYWLYGDYNQSLSILAATGERMKHVLGESDARTLTALDNLGVSLGSWRRFKESKETHERVLRLRTVILGPDDPDTLTTKLNLGMALLDLGHLQEAESLVSAVYEKRQLLLGKEHPWTLWAVCYLCKIYIEMRLFQKAEDLLVWGLAAATRSLGEDHLGVLMGRGYLALLYSRQGNLEAAEKLATSTLLGMEKSRGEAHPDTIFCQWKIAVLYQRLGRYAEAVAICQLALTRADLRITRQHPLAKDIELLLSEVLAKSEDQGPRGRRKPRDSPTPRARLVYSPSW